MKIDKINKIYVLSISFPTVCEINFQDNKDRPYSDFECCSSIQMSNRQVITFEQGYRIRKRDDYEMRIEAFDRFEKSINRVLVGRW